MPYAPPAVLTNSPPSGLRVLASKCRPWMTTWLIGERPPTRPLAVPVLISGRAPLPYVPIRIGSFSDRPDRLQMPKLPTNVSPRLNRSWSAEPLRINDSPREMVLTGLPGDVPLLLSLPELLT